MMKNMKLQEGNTVILKNTQVPRATYVKLQPHTKDFLDISDPKSMYVNVPHVVASLTKSHNYLLINIFLISFFPLVICAA